MNSLILSTATRFLVPVIVLLSFFVFYRGHNEPGGGFIGGLLGATAFALLEKARGREAAERAMIFPPQSIAAFGLGCALLAGVWGGLQYGYFLKGVWPFYERYGLPFGSIFLFDLGVYLVVLGTVCSILFALEDAVDTQTDGEG
jgi:multicomponent Na+:H+ antiporter subunit B